MKRKPEILKKHRILPILKSWQLIIILFSFSIVMAACGGGGGGGGSPADPLDSLPYTGLTSPAVMTVEDVEDFMLFVQFGNVFTLDPVPRTASVSSGVVSRGLVPVSAAQVLDSTPGECGGLLRVDLTVNEATGDFQGSAVYEQYDDCEFRLNGTVRISGQINIDTLQLNRGVISFELLEVFGNESGLQVWSGTSTITESGLLETEAYDIRVRLESTGKVYWLNNYQTTEMYGFDSRSYEDETIIAGRFYDPDRGYVDLRTLLPIRTYEMDEWPSAGLLIAEAANTASVRLRFISPVLYQVEADLDGDGDYEFDTGNVHFPGANTLPVVDAGGDNIGNVGCQVTFDGSLSSDADQDPLEYTWTVVSAPVGSTADLSTPMSATTLFTPDLKGSYQFSLSITDGYDTVDEAVNLTVYGDLFCLDSKQIIPLAEYSVPRSILIDDVTGDGRDDVVMATSTFNSVNSDPEQDFHLFILAQNAVGDLLPPVSYPAGDGNAMGIADLDGDGRNDVAVTAATGVGVFYQNQDGTLAAMQLLPFGETVEGYDFNQLVVADFTGDGRADIVSVYSKFEAAKIRLYTQTSMGTLASPVLYTTDPGYWIPHAADINNDMQTDLVLSSSELGRGLTYMGVFVKSMLQSAATLADPADYLRSVAGPELTSTSDMALVDFTGDGRLDVAAAIYETSPVEAYWLHLYPQREDGTPASALMINAPSFYRQFEVFDFTHDGIAELMAVESGNEMFIDFRRTSTTLEAGEWDRYPLGLPNYNYSDHMTAIGDLNGDGATDLAAATYVGTEGGTGLVILPGKPVVP